MIVKRLGYVELEDLKESGDIIYPLSNRVFGRVLAADVKDPVTGELLFKQGQLLVVKILLSIAEFSSFKNCCSFCINMPSKTWCLCAMLWL